VIDTLEHVERPWEAMGELYRVLDEQGVLVMTVPFNFAIHCHPDDYWRFTPQAVTSLLRPFAQTWVRQVGLTDDPVTVLAVAAKGELEPHFWQELDSHMEPLITLWDAVTRNWPG
jgi:ubiquinone/menaquinone biosynthesis C-methylase UbiE